MELDFTQSSSYFLTHIFVLTNLFERVVLSKLQFYLTSPVLKAHNTPTCLFSMSQLADLVREGIGRLHAAYTAVSASHNNHNKP